MAVCHWRHCFIYKWLHLLQLKTIAFNWKMLWQAKRAAGLWPWLDCIWMMFLDILQSCTTTSKSPKATSLSLNRCHQASQWAEIVFDDHPAMGVRRDLNNCALNLEVKCIALLLHVDSEWDRIDLRIHDMLDGTPYLAGRSIVMQRWSGNGLRRQESSTFSFQVTWQRKALFSTSLTFLPLNSSQRRTHHPPKTLGCHFANAMACRTRLSKDLQQHSSFTVGWVLYCSTSLSYKIMHVNSAE